MERCCLTIALLVLFAAPLFAACGTGISSHGPQAADGRDGGGREPAREPTTLVKARDVSGGQAARCLGLEDDVGRLGAELEANEKETFAGLEYVNGPAFCATTYFTREGEGVVRSYVAGSPLEDLVAVKAAEASLRELGAAQAEATRIAGELDVPVASDIDITGNRAELYPPDRASFEKALRGAGIELPDHVVVLGPEEPPRPPETSDPDPGVFLPRQRFGSGGGMMALIRGRLVLDEKGCLRIEDRRPGHDPVPVWPADFGVDASDDGVRVLSEDGRTVATVGREMEVGGGEIPERALEEGDLMDGSQFRELSERCPGAYWLVAAG